MLNSSSIDFYPNQSSLQVPLRMCGIFVNPREPRIHFAVGAVRILPCLMKIDRWTQSSTAPNGAGWAAVTIWDTNISSLWDGYCTTRIAIMETPLL